MSTVEGRKSAVRVKITVSNSWKRFIFFCQNEIPYGDVSVRIVNGEPTDLLECNPKVRFDKPLVGNKLVKISGASSESE